MNVDIEFLKQDLPGKSVLVPGTPSGHMASEPFEQLVFEIFSKNTQLLLSGNLSISTHFILPTRMRKAQKNELR